MNKIIKITALHLSHGGVEKVICSLANLFVSLGYEVELLCTYRIGEPAYYLDSRVEVNYLINSVPNKDLIFSAIKNRKFVTTIKEGLRAINILYKKHFTMRKAIKNTKCGIIISTRHETNKMLSKYGNKNVYKIAQLHHDHHFNKKMISDFQRKYSKIDIFLLLNNQLTEEVNDIMVGHNQFTKVITVPNFLENDILDEVTTKEEYVVSVGRLHSDKGFDRLLKIWKKVVKQLPNHKLIIIGDGDLNKELRSLSDELGLKSSVIFKGMLDHPSTLSLMRNAQMYLMTSITEGLPMVLLEAMSQGTVPIAYDVRVGPGAIITNRFDGFIIPDEHEDFYVQTIIDYLKKYENNNKFEKNAIQTSMKYSKNNVLDLWINVLDRKIK